MSRSFRYWTRCALVATLTLIVTLNPAWAGRGLRGWLKKRNACCGAVPCCTVAPTCAPVNSSCGCLPVGGCSIPDNASIDCGCESAAWGTSDPTVISSADTHSGMGVVPAPSASLPQVESSPLQVTPEPSPSDVEQSPATSQDAEPTLPETESPEPVVEDRESLEPSPSLPEVSPPVADSAPAIEPEVPTTEDVFGLDDEPELSVEQPSDADLFEEPEATEPEATEPDIPDPLDLFDEPVDPLSIPDSSSDDLFSDPPSEPAALPPSNSDDDFFGAPSDSRLVPDDDLFGQPAPSATIQSLEEAVVDAPATQTQVDDLFGDSDLDDDLFGTKDTPTSKFDESVESPQIPSVDDEDDLFGSPKTQGRSEDVRDDDDVDLFGLDNRRVWRDNTGMFEVEATLAEIHSDHVRLLKSNGNHCNVPLRRLSVEDRALVELIVGMMPPGGIKLVSVPTGM